MKLQFEINIHKDVFQKLQWSKQTITHAEPIGIDEMLVKVSIQPSYLPSFINDISDVSMKVGRRQINTLDFQNTK